MFETTNQYTYIYIHNMYAYCLNIKNGWNHQAVLQYCEEHVFRSWTFSLSAFANRLVAEYSRVLQFYGPEQIPVKSTCNILLISSLLISKGNGLEQRYCFCIPPGNQPLNIRRSMIIYRKTDSFTHSLFWGTLSLLVISNGSNVHGGWAANQLDSGHWATRTPAASGQFHHDSTFPYCYNRIWMNMALFLHLYSA